MRVVAAKSLHLVLVVLAVSAITFLVLDLLPVSIAHQLAGQGATAGDVAALAQRLGLNDPLLTRYGRWLGGVVGGNLGNSLSTGQPVSAALRSQLPVTLELVALSLLVALAFAVPAGILSAWQSGGWLDRLLTAVGFALTSLPTFALSLMLIFFCSLRMKWFPATGFTAPADGVWSHLRGMVLPALSIGLVEGVILMHALRTDLIATLQEDFILLARAKGLPTWSILLCHALRPSCFSMVTLLGMHFGNLISSAVIVENLFALPGIGRLLLSSIFAQDFPLAQGCVLVIAVGYVLLNFLVDLCYPLLDPRIRKEGFFG